jgi:hypothetical protein
MYQLIIRPFGSQTSTLFKYDDLASAIQDATDAMGNGYHRTPKQVILLGDGSILNVCSDESIEKEKKAKLEAKRSGGLVISGRGAVEPEDFILHVQFGLAQLPPFRFATEDLRTATINDALRSKVLEYVFEKGHDYLFVMVGSGMEMICMQGEEFLRLRREAIAAMLKQTGAAPQSQIVDPRSLMPLKR